MTLAEQKGYTTRYYNDYVSGGTHQQWNWYGIKIDDFDNEHLENNFAKVVKILEDVGITLFLLMKEGPGFPFFDHINGTQVV